MGLKANGVSELGIRVSAAIRAELAARRQTHADLCRVTGKSLSYVNARMADRREWNLEDLGRMCEAWDVTPEELLRRSRERAAR